MSNSLLQQRFHLKWASNYKHQSKGKSSLIQPFQPRSPSSSLIKITSRNNLENHDDQTKKRGLFQLSPKFNLSVVRDWHRKKVVQVERHSFECISLRSPFVCQIQNFHLAQKGWEKKFNFSFLWQFRRTEFNFFSPSQVSSTKIPKHFLLFTFTFRARLQLSRNFLIFPVFFFLLLQRFKFWKLNWNNQNFSVSR